MMNCKNISEIFLKYFCFSAKNPLFFIKKPSCHVFSISRTIFRRVNFYSPLNYNMEFMEYELIRSKVQLLGKADIADRIWSVDVRIPYRT